MPGDLFSDLLETRLAYGAARRFLDQLDPDDLGRPAAEALLERARERYGEAVKALDTAVALAAELSASTPPNRLPF
jgi:hypothetical protein